MANRKRPEVGQKVFVVEFGHRHSDPVKTFEATVSSVGRKYFYLEGLWDDRRFFIETWRYDSDRGVARYRLYESEQEYRDEVAKEELWAALRKLFSAFGKPEANYSLEQLRKVAEVMGVNTNEDSNHE